MAYGSDFLTGGVASSSSYYSDWTPAKAVDDIVDTTHIWGCFNGSDVYWQYDLGEGVTKKPAQLALTTDNQNYPPAGYTLLGSITGAFGGEQTIISSNASIGAWANWEKKTFQFSPPADGYRYLRLVFTGGLFKILAEIEMMEEEGGGGGEGGGIVPGLFFANG
ncbi:MAG: discoidin domain-containing protein [Methanocellales archaeon]|nr:discoidin domain-containing protein [Methanocellales archaeon]